MKPSIHDELLAHADPPAVSLSIEECDRVARLARRLTQENMRRKGLPLNDAQAAPYEALPAEQRAAMRAGVVRVMQALALLGILEGT
jgi:hypothetical protein